MAGGRPKGYPKTGGREKGTPNAQSWRTIADKLEAAGIDPTKRLIELLPKLKEHQQAGIYIEWQRQLHRGDEEGEGQRTPPSSSPAQSKPTDELLRQVLQQTAHANRNNGTTGTR